VDTGNRLGWILVGTIVGAAAAVVARSEASEQRPAVRLEMTSASSPLKTHNFVFIRDSKNGGCWLGVTHAELGSAMSIAVAPNDACR